jgi:L-asparagine transporter-like permease
MIPWQEHSDKKSPFVSALHEYANLGFVPHVFNGALIIAGFSTMSASLFAITTMLVTMADDHDAPKLLAKQGKLKVPPIALLVTISGLVASIVTALLMPDSIYEYITTAAGLMLLYNWILVLFSAPRLITFSRWDHIKRFIGLGLIVLAISGTLLHASSRPGLFVSLLIVLIIIFADIISHFVKGRAKKKKINTHNGKIKSHRHYRKR